MKAIDDAVVDYKAVTEKKIKQDEERRNYELALREFEETQQGDRPEEPHFDEVLEMPKSFHSKHFALVVDTLGQERFLSLAQRK